MLAYVACFTHSTEYNNGTCMVTKFAVSCNSCQFINLLFMFDDAFNIRIRFCLGVNFSIATSTHAVHATDHNNA